jgi:hypothetical protein
MQFIGKRTYIVAVIFAIISIVFWYEFRDNSTLATGIISSFSMIGMRSITGTSIGQVCEKLFKYTGEINMNTAKLMQDVAKLFADGMALETYFSAHPEILTMLQALVADGTAIVADMEATQAAVPK